MTAARLILVHGRAQQGKSEAHLIDEWMSPLRATLGARASCFDRVEIRAPFYGDKLIELLGRLEDPEPADILVRGPPQDEAEHEYHLFVGSYLDAVREQEGLAEEQVLLEAGMEAIDRGPQNWPWVLAIIRALDRIPGLDGALIERLLRDVWIYLERRTIRNAIDAIVAPAFDTDLPVICVAHSLGTVVAYNILAGRSVGHVRRLVTLGSPLGIEICRRALAPLSHPRVVEGWFNARDKRDVVALHPLDSAHFPVSPLVDNYDGVWNRTPNAHGISGYVTNARVADEIHRALTSVIGVRDD